MGKKFRLRSGDTRTLKAAALDGLRLRGRRRHDFWALKDLSFDVRRGETLGIIGANGAGKSTLLALLAGTKTVTEGQIRTQGVISSLLELGAGFHPDLTGRENVFLCGSVLGLSLRQVRERFDAIVEFSGIGEFIDQPVKHYSSGMYVRLGFAVAVEVDPDILLIDEVLAVGDAVFQRRCVERMKEFKRLGKTMLIISHDLPTVQSISDRILLLDGGRIEGLGKPQDILGRYQSLSGRRNAQGLEREWGTGEARITKVTLCDGNGAHGERFRSGDAMRIVIGYETSRRIEDPVFGFSINDEMGRVLYGNNTQNVGFSIPEISGRGTVMLHMERIDLAAGTYLLSLSLHSADHRVNYHRLDHFFPMVVESERQFEGCFMPVRWSMEAPS